MNDHEPTRGADPVRRGAGEAGDRRPVPGEPEAATGRPTGVTRPDPTGQPHADHDRLLVAAYAAGDLEGDEATGARTLLDSCAECRTLAAELGAVTAAVRTLPAPARPRDFRIGAEEVAAIERRGLRRFLPSAWPDLAFARPLGTALTTLGVAGLLFAAVLGASPVATILSNVGSAVGPADGALYAASMSPEQATSGGQDSGSKGQALAPSAAASAASSPAIAAASAASSPASGHEGVPTTPSPSGPPAPQASLPPAVPSPAASTPANANPGAKTAEETGSGGVPLLPAASLAAVLVGLGLLGADRLVRRR